MAFAICQRPRNVEKPVNYARKDFSARGVSNELPVFIDDNWYAEQFTCRIEEHRFFTELNKDTAYKPYRREVVAEIFQPMIFAANAHIESLVLIDTIAREMVLFFQELNGGIKAIPITPSAEKRLVFGVLLSKINYSPVDILVANCFCFGKIPFSDRDSIDNASNDSTADTRQQVYTICLTCEFFEFLFTFTRILSKNSLSLTNVLFSYPCIFAYGP